MQRELVVLVCCRACGACLGLWTVQNENFKAQQSESVGLGWLALFNPSVGPELARGPVEVELRQHLSDLKGEVCLWAHA